jgi:hypothetical protein
MVGSLLPEVLLRKKGVTPARLAISCSPICQCMASTARHGMAISSATFDHMLERSLMEEFVSKPYTHAPR